VCVFEYKITLRSSTYASHYTSIQIKAATDKIFLFCVIHYF